MKSLSPQFLVIIGLITTILCCILVVACGALYGIYQFTKILPTITAYYPGFPGDITPTPFEITRQSADQIPTGTINLLNHTNIPEYDLSQLACGFRNLCNISPTLPPPSAPKSVGTQQDFWVNSEDTNSYFQVTATLRYTTPHVYFWIENSISYNEQDVRDLVDAFENKIYPKDREFFGSEWAPGVDDDPHIYILYTYGLGMNVAGYFYSPDEYNPLIRKYSNAHEMFYIDSSQPLDAEYTYGALAHEFQHMIHWYQDRNETSFLNEGFSELATFLNGYDTGGFDWYYLLNPDVNLTDWLGSGEDNSDHYGASFLFVTYLLDRFGEDITKELVHDQLNGLTSIDDTLTRNNIIDPQTEQIISADDFFLDWTIANFVQDASVRDGRYSYHNYASAPQASETETISTCTQDKITRTVNQYGVDYIGITCPGSHVLKFEGATSTRLVTADPHSGSYAFWSNLGDESDMTLTREFDFSGVPGTITLKYWTWYDIEQDYDYAYVESSADGQEWQILTTPSGTASDPNGASFGWAYTGQSNGWIQETVDLSQFAGEKVFIRFEYITDPAVNGEGLLLDDVSIPEIGYTTDFETEDESWLTNGFARIENSLPQTFRLALITHRLDGTTTVSVIPPSADQTAEIPLEINQNEIRDMVLVVTGTTRYTRQLAPYQISIR